MMKIKTNSEKMKAFVTKLHADGKKPCERFGLSWNSLSDLEKNIPQLTCKTVHNGSRTA